MIDKRTLSWTTWTRPADEKTAPNRNNRFTHRQCFERERDPDGSWLAGIQEDGNSWVVLCGQDRGELATVATLREVEELLPTLDCDAVVWYGGFLAGVRLSSGETTWFPSRPGERSDEIPSSDRARLKVLADARTRPCAGCEEVFTYERKSQRYCSQQCRQSSNHTKHKKERHHAAISG